MAFLRPPIPLSHGDLDTLLPGSVVIHLVVSAYMRLIERRSRFYHTLPTVWAAKGNFLPALLSGDVVAVIEENVTQDMMRCDILLFPIHLPPDQAYRWSLVVVRPAIKECVAYDPTGAERKRELSIVLVFLKNIAKLQGVTFDPSEWCLRETAKDLPGCGLTTTGGVLVLVFAELLAREASISGRKIVALQARKTISSVLRAGRFDREDFSVVEPTAQENFKRYGISASYSNKQTLTVWHGHGLLVDVTQQEDPLLRELNELSRGVYEHQLFPAK